MQEALSESETQGDALFEQSFGDCQLYALTDNNVNDATFHDDFPAPLPACEYLDMPTIFNKDISNNGVAYYTAIENPLSLFILAFTTAASEICSHNEILYFEFELSLSPTREQLLSSDNFPQTQSSTQTTLDKVHSNQFFYNNLLRESFAQTNNLTINISAETQNSGEIVAEKSTKGNTPVTRESDMKEKNTRRRKIFLYSSNEHINDNVFKRKKEIK